MTFQEVFIKYRQALTQIMDEREAGNIFFLVVEHLIGWSKTQFVINRDNVVEKESLEIFNNYLKRLKTNEPVQYILQEAWFYGRSFYVNHHTLIPRSETEQLIEIVKSKVNISSKILDVGTGSGCIAITLATECHCSIFAFDKSQKALDVALFNANKHNVQVDFFLSDVLNPLQLPIEKFDVIVSNPPYVLEKEKSFMQENILRFEPSLALFVPDDDPLLFYKAIVQIAHKHLYKNGWLFFEINEQYGNHIAELLVDGYRNVEIIKDIHEKDRFVVAQNNSL